MLNKKVVATTITIASLLFGAVSPAMATNSGLDITGNGSGSTNTVYSNQNVENTVTQKNEARISNDVSTYSNTGKNTATDNVGGNVLVDTGNISSNVEIQNKANLNRADINTCGCGITGSANISGNGSGSTNNATLKSEVENEVDQSNKANIDNSVYNKANTGENHTDRNVGGYPGSDITVYTGNISTDTKVKNLANANVAQIGASGGSSSGGSSALNISGNGSGSQNSIKLSRGVSNSVEQDNYANIDNRVKSYATTGKNTATDNVKANIWIDTGSVMQKTLLDTKVNLNLASLGLCNCLPGVSGSIYGNGSGSTNKITSKSEQENEVNQGGRRGGNKAYVDNTMNSSGLTGYNYADRNVGKPHSTSDTYVFTGSVISDKKSSTDANVNIVGSGLSLPSNWNLDVYFNLGDVLGMAY